MTNPWTIKQQNFSGGASFKKKKETKCFKLVPNIHRIVSSKRLKESWTTPDKATEDKADGSFKSSNNDWWLLHIQIAFTDFVTASHAFLFPKICYNRRSLWRRWTQSVIFFLLWNLNWHIFSCKKFGWSSQLYRKNKSSVRHICVDNWHGYSYTLFIFCEEQIFKLKKANEKKRKSTFILLV